MANPYMQFTIRQYAGPPVPVKGQSVAPQQFAGPPAQQFAGPPAQPNYAYPGPAPGYTPNVQNQAPVQYPVQAFPQNSGVPMQQAAYYPAQPFSPPQVQPVLMSFRMQGQGTAPPPVVQPLLPQMQPANAQFPGQMGQFQSQQAAYLQGYPQGTGMNVPHAVVTTLKPNQGMAMYKPGPMQMPLTQSAKAVNYAQSWEPVKQQTKPVVQVLCNACNKQLPETDIFSKKCPDPGESVCYSCVYTAYMAKPSPTCPSCQREYTENELVDIHQLMLTAPQYAGQVGQTPKKPGAEYTALCVFNHYTHKTTIIPNICPNGCFVCRHHYEQSPNCVCGQLLGMHLNGDLQQFQ